MWVTYFFYSKCTTGREKYGLPLAIWVACELWDFGTMSTLFSGMKEREQDEIAQKYGLENGRVFATWLRSLNYLRNVCAHHSRLWNRNIVDQPKLPSGTQLLWVRLFEHDVHARARCFLLLFICNHMVKKSIPILLGLYEWKTIWKHFLPWAISAWICAAWESRKAGKIIGK